MGADSPWPAAIVLVHGSWIGPDSWERVAVRLRRLGVPTAIVDRTDPLAGGRIVGDMQRNVTRVREVLDRFIRPIVLCGHSAGGSIISRAACDRGFVRELVYIAGFMTQYDETPFDLGGEPSAAFQSAMRYVDQETTEFDGAAARTLFFNDCDEEAARVGIRSLRPQQLGGLLNRGAPGAAWHDRPSTYVLCKGDQALSPDVQRSVARRATSLVEWPTGHAPHVSRPDLVVELLTAIVLRCG